MSEEFYSLNVECWNCDWSGAVSIPQGITFKEHAPRCGRCGCASLKIAKSWGRLTDPNIKLCREGIQPEDGCAFAGLPPGVYGLVCGCPKHSVRC